MKKRIGLVLLALFCVLVLAGCGCEHDWVEAKCDTPKTCSLCQETDGAPLGHSWQAATCQAAKTCEVCGATEGAVADHNWQEATCVAPKHCQWCNLTEGAAMEHTWRNATTETPKTCEVCGTTEGERIVTDARFITADNRALFGQWEYEMTMTGQEMGIEGYVDSVVFVAALEFCEDGKLSMTIRIKDEDSFMAELYVNTEELMYQQFESMNLSREDADILFQDTYDMTIAEYAVEIWSEVDWDSQFDQYTPDFVYYAEGDQIYLADSWEDTFLNSSYTIEGDLLTIQDSALSGGTVLELTRATE